MQSVMNVLGIALIVFGIVAVVYMVMNFAQNDTLMMPENQVDAPPPQESPMGEPAAPPPAEPAGAS